MSSEEKKQQARRKKMARLFDKGLVPVYKTYQKTRDWVMRVRKKTPAVFHEIEGVVKRQFISFETGKRVKKGMQRFTDVIKLEFASKLPVDEKRIGRVMESKETSSFIDLITRGLGEEKEYTKISKAKLFKRVLIANRGEIAVRIIRACRELGIQSVQIYTKQDEKELAVKFADKSVKIGNKASDYLDMERIIRIATRMHVDAIHPGYGFLSENANFAKLCKEHGIKFIGPSAEAINAMGDKINAKKLIKAAGIPTLEGTATPVVDVSDGIGIAKFIGFPVIIKAAAGGGGKGMRIVRKEEELEAAFTACQNEAFASFKNKDVFIERYLEDPRHIEFQILGDRKGNVLHLGERDCSIQRRHQKLIEEAPSTALNPELRERMGSAAVAIGKLAKYEGAGTVEFLLDGQGRFFFMEMNTRIQVEHGITEMITGIDLVKEQLKIAAGAQLAFAQEDIQFYGWAIECRINAECPNEGFCPDTGTLSNYLPPGGPGIRVCSSSHKGQVVSPHYDSMIAKLMCAGKTRDEAIDRMRRALDEFIVEGVETTIPFHKTVLASKAFQQGKITTSFIEKNKIIRRMKEFMPKKSLTQEDKAIIITTAVAAYVKKRQRFNDKQSAWVRAGRQEAMSHE